MCVCVCLQERHCYVAYDFEAELKKANQTTLVRSGWARGGNTVRVDYDVNGNGNAHLPGYEGHTLPDTITMESERFQAPEALFDPYSAFGVDHMLAGIHKCVWCCVVPWCVVLLCRGMVWCVRRHVFVFTYGCTSLNSQLLHIHILVHATQNGAGDHQGCSH